jgi:hypothetical protein
MACEFYENGTSEETEFEGHASKSQCICLHSFADLSHVSPAAFMYLLRECYIHGIIIIIIIIIIICCLCFHVPIHTVPCPSNSSKLPVITKLPFMLILYTVYPQYGVKCMTLTKYSLKHQKIKIK